MAQHGNAYFRRLLCCLKDFNAPPVDHAKMGTHQISIHTLTAMQRFSPAVFTTTSTAHKKQSSATASSKQQGTQLDGTLDYATEWEQYHREQETTHTE